MCLDTIEPFEVNKFHGWQIFTLPSDPTHDRIYLYSWFRFCSKAFHVNKWYNSSHAHITSNHWDCKTRAYKRYRSGFHIFQTRAAARKFFSECFEKIFGKTAKCADTRVFCIRKVIFRDVVATGTQGEDKKRVIVARQRKITNVRG